MRHNMSGQARGRRGAARAGFTIIEVIVIILIIGVLAAVIAPRLLSRVGQSKVAVAASNAASLSTAMKLYIADNGEPESGAAIDVLWTKPANAASWKGPYVDNEASLRDPWGNLFVLRIPGEVNKDFDIVSYGKDGAPGGEGENEDIVNGKAVK
ncbi:MAG: type II secretion system major pseudopilin GspG [Phycisphaerales bacterium]|jgi:general secretion pathway protein G